MLFSGWQGWFCTLLNAKDDQGIKLSGLMLELLVENLNFDGKVGSFNCLYLFFEYSTIETFSHSFLSKLDCRLFQNKKTGKKKGKP